MLVSADEAAKLMGMTPGHLRRALCPGLRDRGLAYHGPGPEGGQPRWWIDRRADLALAPGRAGESHRPSNRELYTDKQNRVADLKIKCVEMLRHARQHWPGAQKVWMGRLLADCSKVYGRQVTRTTLLRWDKNHKGAGTREALIDKRGGDVKSTGDPEAWDYFKQLYLDDRAPSDADCWRRTKLYAEKRGLRWCSESSMYQQRDSRIPPEVQLMHRDPKKWRQQVEAGIDQDPNAWAAGEMWVGDHAQLDFFVRVPGKEGFVRPWITAWIDWRTRRIVGYHVGLKPNSTAILLAFRKAMLDETNRGGPSHVSIDNGKDYDCWMFHGQTKQERRANARDELKQDKVAFAGIYGELQIKTHFSIPYGPNGKSRMERWFRTLHEMFDRSFETYAGRDARAKPEMLARIKKNPALVPTIEQAKADLAEWVDAYNRRHTHDIEDLVDEFGRKLSPDGAMSAWRSQVRLINPRALDYFLMGWHKPVTVGRRGIRIEPYGQPLYYGRHDPALSRYKTIPGKRSPQVLVSYDPDDDRAVRVFTMQRKFICEARLDEMGGGANHEQHRAAARRKSAYKKALKLVEGQHKLMEELSPAQAALAEQPDDPPPTEPIAHATEMKIVPTPIDHQVDAIDRDRDRERMAMAAGAEHLADDEEYDSIFTAPPAEEAGSDDEGDALLDEAWSVYQAETEDDDYDFTLAELGGDVPAGPDDHDTDVSFFLADGGGDDEPDDDGPSVLEMLGE
jgi:transposase InsO family protein